MTTNAQACQLATFRPKCRGMILKLKSLRNTDVKVAGSTIPFFTLFLHSKLVRKSRAQHDKAPFLHPLHARFSHVLWAFVRLLPESVSDLSHTGLVWDRKLLTPVRREVNNLACSPSEDLYPRRITCLSFCFPEDQRTRAILYERSTYFLLAPPDNSLYHRPWKT